MQAELHIYNPETPLQTHSNPAVAPEMTETRRAADDEGRGDTDWQRPAWAPEVRGAGSEWDLGLSIGTYSF